MSVKCVVMGVCGSGKSSVGVALARECGAVFIDGDLLHPRSNIEKMRGGVPLDDNDRAPWLERVSDVFYALENCSQSGVVVCSALKRSYRDVIRRGNAGLCFVHLYGSRELILERMRRRKGHFMKEDMVNSQFATLEFPGEDEPDVLNIDIGSPLETVIKEAIAAVRAFEHLN